MRENYMKISVEIEKDTFDYLNKIKSKTNLKIGSIINSILKYVISDKELFNTILTQFVLENKVKKDLNTVNQICKDYAINPELQKELRKSIENITEKILFNK